MNLEQLTVFTVTDDHARQEEVWKTSRRCRRSWRVGSDLYLIGMAIERIARAAAAAVGIGTMSAT